MTAPAANSKWTAGDVLDVETLCEQEDAPALASADRERLSGEFSTRAPGDLPRPELFRRWLELRRAKGGTLPGKTLDRVFSMARTMIFSIGVMLGFTGAGGYLLYLGREPVNPFWFFLWLVLMPLIFTLGLIVLARAWHDWSGPGALARWLVGAVCRRLQGPARTSWQAWAGAFARHRDRHAALAVWPLLGISQRAALGFSAGAVAALVVRVMFTDLSFGWQSSAGWEMETWHAVVRAIAAPWAWLFPSACPTVEQLRATHFTFAEGVRAIDPGASAAWWKFLAGSLMVWGVGLRGLAVLWIDARERSALGAVNFNHSDANAVHRALTGPLFASEVSAGHAAPGNGAAVSHPHAPGREWLLLADENADQAAAERALAAGVGGRLAGIQALAVDDPGGNDSTLAAIRAWAGPVAVLLSAARDPILAIKKTLAAMAAACAGRECVVLLQGDAGRLPLWRKFAAAHRLELEIISVP